MLKWDLSRFITTNLGGILSTWLFPTTEVCNQSYNTLSSVDLTRFLSISALAIFEAHVRCLVWR